MHVVGHVVVWAETKQDIVVPHMFGIRRSLADTQVNLSHTPVRMLTAVAATGPSSPNAQAAQVRTRTKAKMGSIWFQVRFNLGSISKAGEREADHQVCFGSMMC